MPPQSPSGNAWLPYRKHNSAARVRLICLPFAGGGASAFRGWDESLPMTVDVCAVQPPGRENRFRDPPFSRFPSLISALADAVAPLFDKSVVIYGHSMGALAAFELARELRRRGQSMPTRLLVAGRGAPHQPLGRKPIYNLPDSEFRQALMRFNGTPAAVLANDELMQIFMPTLRADFTAHETYVYQNEPPLDCPIIAIGGESDEVVTANDLNEWQQHTRSTFHSHILPGGHFFLYSQRAELLQLIVQYVEPK